MIFARQQPPTRSPLHAGALRHGALALLGARQDPRPALIAQLRARYAADHVRLCGSGTEALQLAIEEGCRRADGTGLVALPAFGCYDLATAAAGAQARISLYDVDVDTLAPDLESFEHVLRRGARVAVVAPFYGVPVPWHELLAIAQRHNAILIEDAAQAHGATWRGRPVGSYGEISVISFGRGKGWTGGSGGALMLRGDPPAGVWPADENPTRSSTEVRTLIAAAAQWALARPQLYSLPSSIPGLHLGETHYHEPGTPQPMTRTAAAIVLAVESASDSEAASRRTAAQAFCRDLRAPVEVIGAPEGGVAGYLRLPVRMKGASLAAIAALEMRASGVAATYPTTLAALPQINERLAVQAQESFDGADAIVREVFTIPTHSLVTPDDRALLFHNLRDMVFRVTGS